VILPLLSSKARQLFEIQKTSRSTDIRKTEERKWQKGVWFGGGRAYMMFGLLDLARSLLWLVPPIVVPFILIAIVRTIVKTFLAR